MIFCGIRTEKMALMFALEFAHPDVLVTVIIIGAIINIDDERV